MSAEWRRIIDGKYELLKEIGRGGMSTVYMAMDIRLHKQWAVKQIRKMPDGSNQDVIVCSLMAEANLMKRLDHPALPRIVDIIECDEDLYIVMDYIQGETLDRMIRDRGPQKQETVIEWARQLCDVLDYLHSQKPPIIYRDMKPANIMLKPEGYLKLVDFGIAREYKERQLTDTRVLGTNGYAPPEQYGARQTDARSDIYALGMTLHYLLTGADPGSTDYIYRPIRAYNMNLSVGLERIINQCTALEPDKRYQNCQELLAALAHYNEAGGRHRQKQHFKWTFFLFFLSINVLVLSGGLGVQKYRIYQQHQKYEQKINISTATPYETRVTTYLEAIDLVGADTRAYLQLLDAYTENGCFGDEQSSEFSARFNAHKNEFLKDSEAYLQLLYKVGITYFYLYSGGDGSFRTRVLKSYPYFEEIVISEQEAFDYYGAAESYYMIGRFYAKYIVNATSIKEPTKEAYTELLSSLSVCMENIDHYHFDDAAYVRLTMYREIANLLNDHRRGLAATGIAEKEVQTLLERIRKETETLSVTQQISIELKESLLAACDMYMDNVHRVYFNIEWRGEQ